MGKTDTIVNVAGQGIKADAVKRLRVENCTIHYTGACGAIVRGRLGGGANCDFDMAEKSLEEGWTRPEARYNNGTRPGGVVGQGYRVSSDEVLH